MLSAEENELLTQTGPGTPFGSYLRHFWQPVFRTQDLPPGGLLPIRRLGEDFTLYRTGDGAPRLAELRCPHRGTQLSAGWIEGDSLRCRYHGWKFAPSGQCVEQPGEDPAFAAKIVLRTYPAVDYLGLIFAYLGEGATAPPLRRFPDFEGAGHLEVDEPEIWPCNFFNRLDNRGDPNHTNWAHRMTQLRLDPDKLTVPLYSTAEEVATGVLLKSASPGRAPRLSHYHLPNTMQMRVRRKNKAQRSIWEDRLLWDCPIDDATCITYDVTFLAGVEGEDAEIDDPRQFADEPKDIVELTYAFGEDVLAGRKRIEDVPESMSFYRTFGLEDYVVQNGQGVVADRTREHLGRLDQGIIVKRAVLLREITAQAKGRPLTDWAASPGLNTQLGGNV